MAKHTLQTLLSTSQLVDRYNYNMSCLDTLHKNGASANLARVHFADLHLVLEVVTRKYLLYNGVDVPVTTHNLAGLAYKLKQVDSSLFQWVSDTRIHSNFAMWDYNELRFSRSVTFYSPSSSMISQYFGRLVGFLQKSSVN